MIYICAWCKRRLPPPVTIQSHAPDRRESHGICRACLERVEREEAQRCEPKKSWAR